MKKLLFLLFFPLILFSQHTISGTFSPIEEFTYAFLYKATPDGATYLDRAELNSEGYFEINLDSTITGIYKIVYALPPEQNNFDFVYNGRENISFNYNIEKGLEFKSSQENKLWMSYTKSMELVNMTISNFYQKESTDEKGYEDIFKTLSDTQKAYEESTNGLLVSSFIKSNKPYVPENFEDISTYSQNLKNHYLKYVDFGDPLLQSSDFLLDRVLTYVFGIEQNASNDTYKKLVDDLMGYIGNNFNVKTALLDVIWNRFITIGNSELALYVADEYLMDLAKTTNNSYLQEAIKAYKSSAIGVKAPDFAVSLTKDGVTSTTSLHQLNDAEQYLVIFWSSSCGHCLSELPEVMRLTDEKPNLKVIAFGLEDTAENWQKEIAKFPSFMHVLGLEKWDNPIANSYNVKATPSYFVLDKNKTIIAKPGQLEDLKAFLK